MPAPASRGGLLHEKPSPAAADESAAGDGDGVDPRGLLDRRRVPSPRSPQRARCVPLDNRLPRARGRRIGKTPYSRGHMKVGLQIAKFSWPGGPESIGPTLGRIAAQADDVGFDSIWVMDHFFQIRGVGRPEEPMLEGMTALGFIAATDQRARLGLMVGGIHYRQRSSMGQGHDDARHPVGRAGMARGRGGVEPGGVRGARVSVPAARRAVRDARGDAPDRPRDVDGRAGIRRVVRGSARAGDAVAQFAAVDFAATAADHDRWWGRAEDAPARCPVRGCHERLRRPDGDPPQVRGPAAALRGDRP